MASTAVLFGSAHSDNGGGDFLLLYIHGRRRIPVSSVSTLVNGLLRMVDHKPTFCIGAKNVHITIQITFLRTNA